eukprot:86822_1
MAQEEDASKLQLGDDFQHARPLWNSEVYHILDQYLHRQEADTPNNALLQKTMKYVKKLHTYPKKESLKECNTIMKNKYILPHSVDAFEIAVLNNVNVATPDEARTLVPTLGEKAGDDDALLEDLLQDLERYRTA